MERFRQFSSRALLSVAAAVTAGGTIFSLMAFALPSLSTLLVGAELAVRIGYYGDPNESTLSYLVRLVVEAAFMISAAVFAGYVCKTISRGRQGTALIILLLTTRIWFRIGARAAAALDLGGGGLETMTGPDWWLSVPPLVLFLAIGAWAEPSLRTVPRVLTGYMLLCATIVLAGMQLQPAVLPVAESAAAAPPFRQRRQPLCIGYHPGFIPVREWGVVDDSCTADEAVYGIVGVGATSRFAPARSISFDANCCPLPAADILTNEHRFVESSCPADFVVTSGTLGRRHCAHCSQPVRCTKINTARYELGPAQSGALWGHRSTLWKEPIRLLETDIPAALRTGILRRSKHEWMDAGCIGYPPGSLLVQKSGKRCYQYRYRELRYRGLPGDPPAGTPVKMYPECDAVTGLYDPDPRCIPQQLAKDDPR